MSWDTPDHNAVITYKESVRYLELHYIENTLV